MVTVAITDTADDGSEDVDGPTLDDTTSDFLLEHDGTDVRWLGYFRFQNLSISAGATISSATLRVYIKEAYKTNNTYTVYGNNDDGDAIANPGNLPSAMTKTTASAQSASYDGAELSWATINDWEETDVTSILQEIVNEGWWASGSDAVFLAEHDGYAGQTRILRIDDLTGTNEAELVYTLASGANPKGPLGMPVNRVLAGPMGWI